MIARDFHIGDMIPVSKAEHEVMVQGKRKFEVFQMQETKPSFISPSRVPGRPGNAGAGRRFYRQRLQYFLAPYLASSIKRHQSTKSISENLLATALASCCFVFLPLAQSVMADHSAFFYGMKPHLPDAKGSSPLRRSKELWYIFPPVSEPR